ncbi:DEAD/DEAH box helicase [Desulfopila sp. IMCC35006]|uniref:DEAD/DEAH box helicase n=1 Tax=Desulfopila sp. IMCC35006 TaxID=2569542 RepID=UPI0010AD6D7D|nr:DEAD/DEAH box helicase [Desulfopila sp. IMCC35006]TKB26507.1 DEAD/DEAH box helicase [Desulfopila sp. IMCC35006]
MTQLWEHQELAIDAVRQGFRKTGKKQMLMLPTGAGKTHIASCMIRNAVAKGLRCLFICDRIELINQASTRFTAEGIEHGIIRAGEPSQPDLQVQICSVQTLARRRIQHFDLAIIDEAHTLHKAHIRLIEANPFGHIVGLSATPFAKGLGKYFNGLVNPITTRKLIDKGYLSDFVAYGPPTIDTTEVKTIAGDFDPQEIGQRADKPKLVADVVETWLRLALGRKTICYATNIAHSQHLVREFRRRGITAEHIDFSTGKGIDEASRAEIIGKFKTGEITVICNFDILTKGFDCPEVSCIIQARPTKSLMIHIQQIGRGLRAYPGKDRCIILDHAGNHERLGFADGFLPAHLDDGKKADTSSHTQHEEKEPPKPKRCPSCDFLKPVGMRKCPACGLLPAHAEDVETAPGRLEKLHKSTKGQYSMEEKQTFLAGLNGWCQSKGWHPSPSGCYGTAIKIYTEKFGKEPSSQINWQKVDVVTEDVRNFLKHRAIRKKKSGVHTRKVSPRTVE